MRLWSFHPIYLDQKGLVALWREALLAKKALLGETAGYASHPQLQRFKDAEDSIVAIDTYLFYVFEEAKRRGFNFDESKLGEVLTEIKMPVNSSQILYEFERLKEKLETRSPKDFRKLERVSTPKPHPLFKVVKGELEVWEKLV